jgi:hypothetical protein
MVATEGQLITLPQASTRLGVALDWFRVRVRRHEQDLLLRGLLVKAGRHRLLKADRLDELLAALTETT